MHNQKNIQNNMQAFVGADVVRRMLTVDAKLLGIKNVQEFISANIGEVHLGVNLQCWLIRDFVREYEAKRIWNILLSLYLELGFVGVQKSLSELLSDVLQSTEHGNVGPTRSDYYFPGRFNELLHLICSNSEDDVCGIKSAAQILGFLTRFTLVEDVSGAASLEKFSRINITCAKASQVKRACISEGDRIVNYGRSSKLSLGVSYTLPSRFILEGIAYELKSILGKQPPMTSGFLLSSGSVAEGAKTVGSKVDLWARMQSHFESNLLDSTSTGVPCEGAPGESYPVLLCVPKSLSSRRVIAPEPLARAVYGQACKETLRTALLRTKAMQYINDRNSSNYIDGQEVNRALAQASATQAGATATIDMSSASDSISRTIFFEVCPLGWRGFFASNISWFYRPAKGEVKKPLHTLFTSGHPLCWDTEACYFLAVARFVCRISGIKEYRSKCYAYGDDLIVPIEAYDALCEVLEILGHTVNRSKSYATGLFRESCGGWYYNHADITPVFWPRSEIRRTGAGLQPLCQLQHRLVDRQFYYAASYLTNVIQMEIPDMTLSPIGAECDDLWDAEGILVDTVSERMQHYVLTPKWQVHKSIPLDHYLYYLYLKYGPSYNSKLDELLGISYPRRRTAYETSEMKWSKAAPLYGVYGKTW